MPSVLSTLKDRIYGREWSFPYNCYEVGHAWTPYCTDAAWVVGSSAFKNALFLYTPLYLFTQLALQRKYDVPDFIETSKSIVTSASFLSFNVFSGMIISCVLRNNSDRYYYRIQCFLPGFISSFIALYVERPSRRPALAFYLANMSSELLWKWYSDKGYIKSLPHGETLLFALGMACWLRFVRIHGFGHDPVSTALKYLIGPLEAKSRARAKPAKVAAAAASAAQLEGCHEASSSEESQALIVAKTAQQPRETKIGTLQAIGDSVTSMMNLVFDCHPVCPHKGVSCVDYSLTPAVTRFAIGYLVRSAMNLSSGYKLLLTDPAAGFKKAFISKSSVNFGLFLGTFVGTSKAIHCILRRIQGKQEVWHSAVAGGLSGMSMIFSPKSTLSTYIIWKCLEQYFFLGVQTGKIKRANEVICLTYAISVNILLYIFALQPGFVRPSYMKFIDNISDHRLHQLNRMVLDIFGTGASQGYEDWFPDLDPKYMSREFQELIFNWMIQPYE